MQAVITYNRDADVPVLTLCADTDGDELGLQLLADSEDFKVVIELPEADELIVKDVTGA
jgi:hypothetical protein